MFVAPDLPLTPCPDPTYSYDMTPELQLVLCLAWVKERQSNSKASSGERLGAVFGALGSYQSLAIASVRDLSAANIESAARQMKLQATPVSHAAAMTRSFGTLATLARVAKRPSIVIFRTSRGYAYPTVAYKSGGKVKGLGSHLYVFLPLCGELKLAPKRASEKLGQGVSIDPSATGPLRSFEQYVITAGGEGEETTYRTFDNSALYGSSSDSDDESEPEYATIDDSSHYSGLVHSSGAGAIVRAPILPQQRIAGLPAHSRTVPDLEDPGYFKVQPKR